jgi:hypothetical protein
VSIIQIVHDLVRVFTNHYNINQRGKMRNYVQHLSIFREFMKILMIKVVPGKEGHLSENECDRDLKKFEFSAFIPEFQKFFSITIRFRIRPFFPDTNLLPFNELKKLLA